MTVDELIEKLLSVKTEHGGNMEVILDTDMVVAPLRNIRVSEPEFIILEI